MKVGDKIEVTDFERGLYHVEGTVLELDEHPFGPSYAKIRIDNSPALPAPEVWANTRMATVRES